MDWPEGVFQAPLSDIAAKKFSGNMLRTYCQTCHQTFASGFSPALSEIVKFHAALGRTELDFLDDCDQAWWPSACWWWRSGSGQPVRGGGHLAGEGGRVGQSPEGGSGQQFQPGE